MYARAAESVFESRPVALLTKKGKIRKHRRDAQRRCSDLRTSANLGIRFGGFGNAIDEEGSAAVAPQPRTGQNWQAGRIDSTKGVHLEAR